MLEVDKEGFCTAIEGPQRDGYWTYRHHWEIVKDAGKYLDKAAEKRGEGHLLGMCHRKMEIRGDSVIEACTVSSRAGEMRGIHRLTGWAGACRRGESVYGISRQRPMMSWLGMERFHVE